MKQLTRRTKQLLAAFDQINDSHYYFMVTDAKDFPLNDGYNFAYKNGTEYIFGCYPSVIQSGDWTDAHIYQGSEGNWYIFDPYAEGTPQRVELVKPGYWRHGDMYYTNSPDHCDEWEVIAFDELNGGDYADEIAETSN